jgi:pimeloyl-ACP methyl ester carboxylesterase
MTATEEGGQETPGSPGPGPGPGPGLARALGGDSRWVDIDGPVHYLDFGGPAGGPVLVCVHGLDGCAVNWTAIAPLLTNRFRVLAPDLAGHGLTRSAGRDTSVTANQALLHRFVESVPGVPVLLMGNSMGGMISLLEAAASPAAVAGLILVDPALPFAPAWPDPAVAGLFAVFAVPWLGQLLMNRRRHQPPEALVARLLSLCCADPAGVSPDVVAQHVEVVRRRAEFSDAERDVVTALRSVVLAAGYGTGQAYRRAVGSVGQPILLLHGDRDRLVPVSVARSAARTHPGWTLVELPGVGHVPQLEAPDECEQAITAWLADGGRLALAAASRPGPVRRWWAKRSSGRAAQPEA